MILQVLLIAATAPMNVGLFMIAVHRSVDRPCSWNEVIAYFPKVGALVLATLLMYIAVFIGFLLLLLPGIYLSIALSLAAPLIVDKNLSAVQALQASRKAISKHWFTVFGLYLMFIPISIACFVTLGIGAIWAMPFGYMIIGIIYRNIFGVSPSEMAAGAPASITGLEAGAPPSPRPGPMDGAV